MNIDTDVIGFEPLYESMCRCRRGVSWKDSVAQYYLDGFHESIRLEKQLKNGTYKPKPSKRFKVTHPKEREILSISFRDRVFQRSYSDNLLYPRMTNSFIDYNMACQKGKGTIAAINALDKFMQRCYKHYDLDFYVLQCDVKSYYPTMSHQVAEDIFKQKLSDEEFAMLKSILRNQYEGDIGYFPGSQIIQIAGVSVLNPLDHYVKEQLHIKCYVRYMDDFILMHPDKTYLEYCLDKIVHFLKRYKFQLNTKKTKIYPVSDGIKFLGFIHRLTALGKIIRVMDPATLRSYRKKLVRMVHRAKKGLLTKQTIDEYYANWKRAHAAIGNSTKMIRRLDRYYNNLWKEETLCT